MDDSEYDIHPLDRDYYEPVNPTKRKATSTDSKLHRFGLYTFAAGFTTLLLAAVVSGNSSPGGSIERLGSYMHRLAMVIILGGGALIIAAYRVPQLKEKIRMRKAMGKHAATAAGSYGLLLVVNVIVFATFLPLAGFLRSIGSTEWYFLLINGILTITSALMVTLVVWHRGMLPIVLNSAFADVASYYCHSDCPFSSSLLQLPSSC